jgi:hypothetical protein
MPLRYHRTITPEWLAQSRYGDARRHQRLRGAQYRHRLFVITHPRWGMGQIVINRFGTVDRLWGNLLNEPLAVIARHDANVTTFVMDSFV